MLLFVSVGPISGPGARPAERFSTLTPPEHLSCARHLFARVAAIDGRESGNQRYSFVIGRGKFLSVADARAVNYQSTTAAAGRQ